MEDVRRLWLLRELAARGTIAATARACSLTPSAVSQQLSVLQREAGVPLYVKDGRGLVLTDAARTLVTHAERVLAELEQAHAGLAEHAGGPRGVVRLAAFPTAASSLVPTAIAACRASHPDVKIVLEEWETADGIARLRSGHIDILLVYEYNLLPEIDDTGIELTPLLTEFLLAAVPQTLQLPRRRLPLKALRDQPWVAPRSDSTLRGQLERACGLSGFTPQLDYTSDDYTVILALVRAGLGVALIPQLATESLPTEVRLRPIAEPPLSRTVSVATRSGSASSPSLAVVIEQLHHAVARLRLSAGG